MCQRLYVKKPLEKCVLCRERHCIHASLWSADHCYPLNFPHGFINMTLFSPNFTLKSKIRPPLILETIGLFLHAASVLHFIADQINLCLGNAEKFLLVWRTNDIFFPWDSNSLLHVKIIKQAERAFRFELQSENMQCDLVKSITPAPSIKPN